MSEGNITRRHVTEIIMHAFHTKKIGLYHRNYKSIMRGYLQVGSSSVFYDVNYMHLIRKAEFNLVTYIYY